MKTFFRFSFSIGISNGIKRQISRGKFFGFFLWVFFVFCFFTSKDQCLSGLKK